MKKTSDKKKKDDSKNKLKDKFDLLALAGKFGALFNPTPQKEKVLRHEDFNAAGDTYYASVSVGYKIIERILIIVLVIFLVVSLISNFSLITYDNFFYLLKDFSTAVDIESSNYDTLSYSSNSRHFFSLYREGLVMANPSNISVYTATGRRTLQATSQFSSPCVMSSNKYFLVYDTAGTSFAVYNSFSRVYAETLDYPVTDACFANDGKIAITTRDLSSRSLVHIYDDNFKRLFTVPSNKFAFDIAMSSESNSMAICYYDIGNGSGMTQIDIRRLSDMDRIETITVDGEFLLQCGYLSSDYFAIITDRSVRIYDKYFEEIDVYEYVNAQISGFCINEYGAAVSYTENSKNYAVAFDSGGKLVFDELTDTAVNDIGIYEGFIFMRTDLGVKRVDYKASHHQFLTSGQGKMLLYSADTVLICGESKAEYLVFEE
ncbi:MAG: hypothetical protein E7653_00925 [Ruminococcaceae bacterium]|nr:hypothetical protein [Oscillospiraceae bacterium]